MTEYKGVSIFILIMIITGIIFFHYKNHQDNLKTEFCKEKFGTTAIYMSDSFLEYCVWEDGSTYFNEQRFEYEQIVKKGSD